MTHICIGKQKDYPCEQCEILRLTARLAKLEKVAECARRYKYVREAGEITDINRTCDNLEAALRDLDDPYAAIRAYEDEHDAIKMGRKK